MQSSSTPASLFSPPTTIAVSPSLAHRKYYRVQKCTHRPPSGASIVREKLARSSRVRGPRLSPEYRTNELDMSTSRTNDRRLWRWLVSSAYLRGLVLEGAVPERVRSRRFQPIRLLSHLSPNTKRTRVRVHYVSPCRISTRPLVTQTQRTKVEVSYTWKDLSFFTQGPRSSGALRLPFARNGKLQ